MIYDYHEITGSSCPCRIAYYVSMTFGDQTLVLGRPHCSRVLQDLLEYDYNTKRILF